MVSDSLDVGQIFFEFDKLKDKVDILVWDKEEDLKKLLASEHKEHKQLGQTYKLYLEQDGPAYHFDQMREMYLLNYKQGGHKIDIIGATSPATLFFTPGNPEILEEIGREIRFGNDSPFDKGLMPLYRRDLDYQAYLYLLQEQTRDFAALFPEVDRYLTASFKKLDSKKNAELKAILEDENKKLDHEYDDIAVGENAGHLVRAIDSVPLKKKKPDVISIEKESGFVIDSTATTAKIKIMIRGNEVFVKPLVLPVDTYTHNTKYTTEAWDKTIPVPIYDERPLVKRTLPIDGSLYPYLTINDFLEETIIKIPYGQNNGSYFNGYLDKDDLQKGDGRFSYLLPLKNLFFDFFTAKNLMESQMFDGKRMLELKNNAGGVTAILRIPIIKDKYIEYRRTYFNGLAPDSERTRSDNNGAIIEKRFGLGILPLIEFPENVKPNYRVGLTDKGRNDVKLMCYGGTKAVLTNRPETGDNTPVVRQKKTSIENSSETYAINENFDRIKVSVGDYQGVVIPKFKAVDEQDGNSNIFTFAVDFGTTNTHIEYKSKDKPNPIPFDITKGEKQMQMLFEESDTEVEKFFYRDFIPTTIGEQQECSFPIRTAYQVQKGIKYNARPITLADGNIPFYYEKWEELSHNRIETELKWTGKAEDVITLYLSNLMFLIRNKVLLGGGNLSETRIIWFYPASMTRARLNQLEQVWQSLYKEYFEKPKNDNQPENGFEVDNTQETKPHLICMSESVAPYYFYLKKRGGSSDFVSIDIGGGTTDVYVTGVEEGEKMLLSFRFAGNAIFGDGHENFDSDRNGFVKRYLNSIKKVLTDNKKVRLNTVLEAIEGRKSSTDIVAFLFSLADNVEVKDNKQLDFSKLLAQDNQMRYVFILFYGALFYYVAKAMKAKGLDMPNMLAFGGNGSKTLRALSVSNETIEQFIRLVFEKVYNQEYATEGKSLRIIKENYPKKATSKGGILTPSVQNFNQIEEIKTTLLGDNMEQITAEQVPHSSLTEEMKQQIVGQVSDFTDFLFKLNEDNKNFFEKQLGAELNLLPFVKKIVQNRDKLKRSLDSGLKLIEQEAKRDSAPKTEWAELEKTLYIEETLFFYPLKGVLHDLAWEISNLKEQ
jgi:hypothetical protein